MPRTPPLILPSSFPSWFNADDANNDKISFGNHPEELQRILDEDVSSFTYTPSDDEVEYKFSELSSKNKFTPSSNHSKGSVGKKGRGVNINNLYHKPPSKQNSQHSGNNAPTIVVNENKSSKNYPLEDFNMLESQQQNKSTESTPTDTLAKIEDDAFYTTIDQLTKEYQTYAEEYREFKRHVDSAKRELAEYISNKEPYFEERGAYLGKKWETLRKFI